MSPRAAIGVDLGGTLVRAGIITEAGEVVRQGQASIAATGPDRGLPIIEQLIDRVLTEAGRPPISGIGIGSTGPIDRDRGTINNPYTLQGWTNVPIVEHMQRAFNVPALLENDTNAAALGEYWLGAGRGAQRLYTVTVGTGVGTSFILNGEIYRGNLEAHPEGGHQLIDPDGPECYCGQRGCLESLVAGPSISRRASAAAMAEGWRPSADTSGERFEARQLAAAARGGDAFALRIMQDVARDLARGIVNIILLFVPDVIVLGGGVMESADLLMPPLLARIKTDHPMVPFQSVRIFHAALGHQAGLFGSAYAMLRQSA